MKVKLFLVSLGTLLAGLLTATNVNADIPGNLLLNGGFNVQGFPYPSDFNLILAPWGWSGSIGYTWANNVATVGPGVTLDAGGMVGFGDGQIYQDVATTPGQTYQLTITAFCRGPVSGTWLQPLWNGAALPLDFTQYLEWTVTTYDIQATGNSTRLTIMPAPNNQGPTWIDSVSLVAVPEPTSLWLLGPACLVLIKRKNVTRKRMSHFSVWHHFLEQRTGL